MRIPVPNDRPIKIVDLVGKHGKGVYIRAVTGGVTFYLALGASGVQELLNVDAGGTPLGGIPLESTLNPQQFNFFADEIWCRSTGIGDDSAVDVHIFDNA